jgi:hypothetical protein
LTYSVHAASTVLACAQRLWSRRNLLDEIDASTLQLLRSCVRFRGRPPSARCPRPAGRHEAVRSTPLDVSVTASAIVR